MSSRLTVLALLTASLQVFAQSTDETTVEASTEASSTTESGGSTVESTSSETSSTSESGNTSEAGTSAGGSTEESTIESGNQTSTSGAGNTTGETTTSDAVNTTGEATTSEPTGVPTFVAPTAATPVPTTADTTAFEITLVTGCSDCRDNFNSNGDPSSAFVEAYEESVASNIQGVSADDVQAALKLIRASTKVAGDQINAVLTIAQENMASSTETAIKAATADTILANSATLDALLPSGTNLTVESIGVTEVTGGDSTTSSSSTSSSVQIGSALSFVCTLLWLIK